MVGMTLSGQSLSPGDAPGTTGIHHGVAYALRHDRADQFTAVLRGGDGVGQLTIKFTAADLEAAHAVIRVRIDLLLAARR